MTAVRVTSAIVTSHRLADPGYEMHGDQPLGIIVILPADGRPVHRNAGPQARRDLVDRRGDDRAHMRGGDACVRRNATAGTDVASVFQCASPIGYPPALDPTHTSGSEAGLSGVSQVGGSLNHRWQTEVAVSLPIPLRSDFDGPTLRRSTKGHERAHPSPCLLISTRN